SVPVPDGLATPDGTPIELRAHLLVIEDGDLVMLGVVAGTSGSSSVLPATVRPGPPYPEGGS
ncbi:MAG: hypothetical protein V3S30_11890, partial [Thermoanaerobaculia bacterium]